MTQFNYRNVNEMILEELLSSASLSIFEEDDDSLIEDAICKTLSSLPSHYIRHHIDFSYSQTIEEKNERLLSIKNMFNDNINNFRAQAENRSWE